MTEDTPKNIAGKGLGDPVAQPAGQYRGTIGFEVFHFFQVAHLDQPFRVLFLRIHPAPELGNEQADVVVNPVLVPHIAGGGGEAVALGEDVTDQGVVQVCNRRMPRSARYSSR
jgi:hypothetical protein